MKNEPVQPATDDPELAQVIAGASNQTQTADPAAGGMQFEEAPIAMNGDQSQVAAPADDNSNNTDQPDVASLENAVQSLAQPAPEHTTAPTFTPQPAAQAPGNLESIKKDALSELRPLVDKLALPSEEKFDIMLLIIRSTDDQSLVAAAHDAAKGIEDETKRAQALLDIVKEIDYFANQHAA